MVLTCKRCGNTNPMEAAFCFFDGQLLQNANSPALAKKPELSIPFVFPNGRKCISFDELVLTLLDEWSESKKLLKQGTLRNISKKSAGPTSPFVLKNAGYFQTLTWVSTNSSIAFPPQST